MGGRHQPGDKRDEPAAENGLEEYAAEGVLCLMGDLLEQDPQNAGLEDMPVDDHGREQRGTEDVGDTDHRPHSQHVGHGSGVGERRGYRRHRVLGEQLRSAKDDDEEAQRID